MFASLPMTTGNSFKVQRFKKCTCATFLCLVSSLCGAASSGSATFLVNQHLQEVDITPKQYEDAEVQTGDGDPNRFHAIEVFGSGARKNGCVFSSIATAIELANHLGEPLVEVEEQKVYELRDGFVSKLQGLIEIGKWYIKSIDFNENGDPVFKFSTFKLALLSAIERTTLEEFIYALGIDELVETLEEDTKVDGSDLEDKQNALIREKADLDRKRAALDAKRADLDAKRAALDVQEEDLNRKRQNLQKEDADWDALIRARPEMRSSQNYIDFLKKSSDESKQLCEEIRRLMEKSALLNDENKIYVQEVERFLEKKPREIPIWLCDIKDLPSVLIRLGRIMGSVCFHEKKEAEKANEIYDASRWSEFATRQSNRIKETEGVGSSLYVVFGMLPASYEGGEELFCHRYSLRVWYANNESGKSEGDIVERDPAYDGLTLTWDDHYRFFPKGTKVLDLVSCYSGSAQVVDGQERWRICGHMMPLVKRADECVVLYRTGDGDVASKSFPVTTESDDVPEDEYSARMKNYRDVIRVQFRRGTLGAKGLDKYSVVNVRKDLESALAAPSVVEEVERLQETRVKETEEMIQRFRQQNEKSATERQNLLEAFSEMGERYDNILGENVRLKSELQYYKSGFFRRCGRFFKNTWNSWFGK